MSEELSLTDLIGHVREGDEEALRRLFDAAYGDLHRIARARLAKSARNALLDTTSLVHESYMRFASAGQLRIEDRVHFMRYAGQAMRSVIVDFARQRQAERYGGQAQHVTLDSQVVDGAGAAETEILNVHQALEELQQHDPRLAQVVEMRYFGGMSEAEIADALGLATRTVRRDWDKARLLLAQWLA
jgi:RNA polymerase sigma factor (TIGR02999 family)